MYQSIEEIKKANHDSGGHWFSPDTMRYFHSRVLGDVFSAPAGSYFVTSEKYSVDSERLYTVRIAKEGGDVKTVGTFQGWETRKEALAECKRLQKEACNAK